MPLVRSRVATVFVGRAPLSSQCFARSSSITISDGSGWGLYWPIVSIVRPSRGERWSATTTLQIGFFLDPTLRSLILTDMRRRRLDDRGANASGAADAIRVVHLAQVGVTVVLDEQPDVSTRRDRDRLSAAVAARGDSTGDLAGQQVLRAVALESDHPLVAEARGRV